MDMLQATVQIRLALLLLVDPVTILYPHIRILGLELLAMGFHIFREIRAASLVCFVAGCHRSGERLYRRMLSQLVYRS